MKKIDFKILLAVLLVLVVTFIIVITRKDSKFVINSYGTEVLEEIDSVKVDELVDNKSNFILFVYNNFCPFGVPCENVFDEALSSINIKGYKMGFDEFKNTTLYSKIKYGPTFILISNGKVVSYLDANDDNDYNKYQDVNVFKEWLLKYIEIN